MGRIPSLRITTALGCNHRCSFCQLNGDYATDAASSQRLSEDVLTRIIDAFIGQGVRHFTLTGGEPLMNPGLTFTIARALKRFVSSERLIGHTDNYVRLNTNGVRLGRYLTEAIDCFDLVKVSLHALDRSRYASITGSKTANADFEAVMQSIRDADAMGLPMRIHCVVTRENMDVIGDMLEFCEGFSSIRELKLFDISAYTTLWRERRSGEPFWSAHYVSLESTEKMISCSAEFMGTVFSIGGFGNPMTVYRRASGLNVRLRRSDRGAHYGPQCAVSCPAYTKCGDGHCNLEVGPDGIIKVCRPAEGRVFVAGEERKALEYFRTVSFAVGRDWGVDKLHRAVETVGYSVGARV